MDQKEEIIAAKIRLFFRVNDMEAMGEELLTDIFPSLNIKTFISRNFKVDKGENINHFTTAGELAEFLGDRLGGRPSSNRVGRILTVLGYEAQAKTIKNRVKRGYYIIPKSNIDLIHLSKIRK